jgi:multisubunit Na+/H+ antiporter MnhC subunit
MSQALVLTACFLSIAIVSFFLGGFFFSPGKRELEEQLAEIKWIAAKYGYTAVRKLFEE